MTKQVKSKPKKNKIIIKGKDYPIDNSAFFRLTSKHMLAKLLFCTIDDIQEVIADPERYHEFEDNTNPEKPRPIQKPKPKLDALQSRIASLLCRISLPDYLHSGRKNHSHVSNATYHIDNARGQVPVLTTDITKFFPSTTKQKVYNFFRRALQCSDCVANILADLCTCRDFVPTGSRISMPIAFWANYPMFSELEQLSQRHDVKMSVYVDDLTFSGASVNKLFCSTVKKIIERHGLLPHPTKTKIYAKTAVKVITGVALIKNDIALTNEQHFKLSQDIESWKAVKDSPMVKESKTFKKIIGRLNSLSIIDDRYKDKARSIRASTHA
ncbi:reverse transcriptase family protein [Aeromonas rivipollensis]|uniref:reverse transcriptase family protein n=1 Tax=Aeromonas rivipollensis TaxID=948519 RepID=UPI00373AEE22